MNLRQYILIFLLGTVIASVAWVMVVLNISAATAAAPAFIVFYLTLFIALNGFFTTLATIVRTVVFSKRKTEEVVTTSLRQGVMFSLLIVGTLFMLSQEILTWWTLVLFVLLLAMLEFFFISAHAKR